jgi:hypothetical protein
MSRRQMMCALAAMTLPAPLGADVSQVTLKPGSLSARIYQNAVEMLNCNGTLPGTEI